MKEKASTINSFTVDLDQRTFIMNFTKKVAFFNFTQSFVVHPNSHPGNTFYDAKHKELSKAAVAHSPFENGTVAQRFDAWKKLSRAAEDQ